MLNLTKLEFVVLGVLEKKNYLSWILDDQIHMDVMNIGSPLRKEMIHPYKIAQ